MSQNYSNTKSLSRTNIMLLMLVMLSFAWISSCRGLSSFSMWLSFPETRVRPCTSASFLAKSFGNISFLDYYWKITDLDTGEIIAEYAAADEANSTNASFVLSPSDCGKNFMLEVQATESSTGITETDESEFTVDCSDECGPADESNPYVYLSFHPNKSEYRVGEQVEAEICAWSPCEGEAYSFEWLSVTGGDLTNIGEETATLTIEEAGGIDIALSLYINGDYTGVVESTWITASK